MRRASTCLALLGLAAAGAYRRRLGRADGDVQGQGGADSRLPAHRQHSRRRRRGRSRIRNQRHRIRRLAAAADRRQLLPADGHEAAPERLPDVLDHAIARTGQARPACPKGSAAGPIGKVVGVVSLRRRTRARGTRNCRSFYAPGGGLEFFTAATRRCRSKSCPAATTPSSAAPAASARSSTPRCRSCKRSRARRTRRSKRSRSRPARRSRRAKQDDLLRHRAEEVPQRRLPGQGRTHRSPRIGERKRSRSP